MSLIRVIKPGVQWIGAIDWDRRLFDALIPLPNGTSYNSYLIKGSEKTALIDAVDISMLGVLLGNLKALDIRKIDYMYVFSWLALPLAFGDNPDLSVPRLPAPS